MSDTPRPHSGDTDPDDGPAPDDGPPTGDDTQPDPPAPNPSVPDPADTEHPTGPKQAEANTENEPAG